MRLCQERKGSDPYQRLTGGHTCTHALPLGAAIGSPEPETLLSAFLSGPAVSSFITHSRLYCCLAGARTRHLQVLFN